MARASGFGPVTSGTNPIIAARSGTGVIAADSATLTDTNIPPANALNCRLYDTIFVGVEIVGGTNPTATIEPLFRDADATDGSRWPRIVTGAADGVTLTAATVQSTGALASNANFVEVRVFGHPAVFLRISATGGTTTGVSAWAVLVMPGKARNVASIPNG